MGEITVEKAIERIQNRRAYAQSRRNAERGTLYFGYWEGRVDSLNEALVILGDLS